jgi:hypothetical protein
VKPGVSGSEKQQSEEQSVLQSGTSKMSSSVGKLQV